jgi:hypothetical protein
MSYNVHFDTYSTFKKCDFFNPKCNLKVCLPKLPKGILPRGPIFQGDLKGPSTRDFKEIKDGQFQ